MKNFVRMPGLGLALGLWVAAGRGLAGEVVINEVHYDPVPANDPVEFIELYHAGAVEVDVGGWRVAGGVELTIPVGTRLAPGSFLVLAQNPAALQARYGVTSVGPWVGRLSQSGERIQLRDAADRVVDEVSYRLGFPWPTVGSADGVSIELVHPGADNDLGGNWHLAMSGGAPARERVLVAERSVWRYRKGTAEASVPRAGWRALGYDDTAWSVGTLPAGYGEDFIATRLDDMRNAYTSVFFRKAFVVEEPAAVEGLVLEAQYDDGYTAWINGVRVAGDNVPGVDPAYDATAVSALESFDFKGVVLPAPGGYLVRGTNVLVVLVHNASVGGSSDFFFDARLKSVSGGGGRGATPGRRNLAFSTNSVPVLRQVEHGPAEPRSGEAVTLAVKVTAEAGVAGVRAEYQVVEPGAYIELTDAAYGTGWQGLELNDAGVDGDVEAGDAIYSGRVPAAVQLHRRLVRYRLVATDREGGRTTAPYADDPVPNFAYFVYDGVPEWRGSIRPGVAPVVTYPVAEMRRLPVYHLISKRASVERATWGEKYTGDVYKWKGTLVYDGQVYDHIGYRARGGVWRYAMGKNMWKFDFNRGHDFRARDGFGRRYDVDWTKLNLGACIQQGDYNHRGEQGMFEAVGFRLFNLAGVESPHTHWVQFRVIDDGEEASAASQFEGDFWGLYLAIEQEDGRFLREHELPDGNLYKMEGGTGELNNLGPTAVSDKSDLNTFLNAYRSTSNPPGDAWWRANLDLARYFSYQAVVQGIHHYDICYGKNYFYYLNPETRLWSVHSWDLDLTWADNMFDAGCGGRDDLRTRVLGRPALAIGYRNRVREVRDLLFNTDQAFRLIDEHAAMVRGESGGPSLLDADRAMWDYNPVMANGSIVNLSKAGQGRFYQFPGESGTNAALRGSFDATVRIMKNYVIRRGAFLDNEALDAEIPQRPVIRSDGPGGWPVNRLVFRVEPYAGGNSFASLEWRLAEITPTNAPAFRAGEPARYEIDAVWQSGPMTTFAAQVRLPADVARVGATYRVRARWTDVTGRASAWSLPVEFVGGAPDQAGLLLDHLRVTEVMYAPSGGAEFEFVEVHNTSLTQALDLAGVRFDRGIDYVFPPGSVLVPGAYACVVRAASANEFAGWRAQYGLGAEVALFGPFGGALNDAGEALRVVAGLGGAAIVAFEYGDGRGWPVAADGAGHSLVPRGGGSEAQDAGWLSHPGAWRASVAMGGSPGRADPEPQATVLLNEVVTHTDLTSEFDSNDWIEVYNPLDRPWTFGPGWYLSDDAADLRKWNIPPATTVGARGWVVFDEASGFHVTTNAGFGLSKVGEQVFLSRFEDGVAGRVVDALRFKGQENGFAFSRYPDGAATWAYVAGRTPAAANAPPQARVVVSEVHFHPEETAGMVAPGDFEFVEIHNPLPVAVALSGVHGGWRLTGEVGYEFAPGTTLEAGDVLVLVGVAVGDAAGMAAFRQRHGLDGSVRVLAGLTGRLNDNAGRITLERPMAPDVAGDPAAWVVADEVFYLDGGAWPATTDGGGDSLQRTSSVADGFAPGAWRAARPSPGRVDAPDADPDGDRIPSWWEVLYGLDPGGAGDAVEDADGDGRSNRDEYWSRTNPRDAASVIGFASVAVVEGRMRLRYVVPAGASYRLQERGAVAAGEWNDVRRTQAGATEVVESVDVELRPGVGGAAGVRLYQLRAD